MPSKKCGEKIETSSEVRPSISNLSEEDADELRTHAMDRIDQLKAPKK